MDIGSLYTDYYSKVASDSKTNKLHQSAKKDLSGSTDEELMDVCKDFESYFVEQVLKQAMDVFTTGEESSSGAMNTLQGFYKDNLIKEYAGKITENQEMGLAKMLYEQMKRNYGESIMPADLDKLDKSESANQAPDKTDDTSAVEAASTALAEEE